MLSESKCMLAFPVRILIVFNLAMYKPMWTALKCAMKNFLTSFSIRIPQIIVNLKKLERV
jgi:hypothetical protein